MSSQQYYMSEIPVTMEDDQDWIKKISKKFKKAQIVEKLTEIGEADFNPKASKKSLIETLLYALREAIDNQVDEGEDSEQDQNEEEEVEQDESEDEAYQPRDDPSYRSELDGDLAEEEQDQIEDDEEEEGDDEDEDTFVARMQKKLGLTDSKSNYFISGWTDPTFLFCIGTLMSVIFVRGNSEAQVLEIVPLNEIPSLLKEHFLDPAWIAGALFLYAAYSQTKEYVQHRFSNSQRIEAGWYLWNGAVIHVMMDGCAGGGWFNATEGGGWGLSLMNKNYQVLDKRFARTAPAGEIAIATVVTQTELFVHSILCLVAYIGICKRSKWADAVALIALSFQLFGAIVFIVPDLLTGCPNMQPFDKLGCMPDATMFTFFYFWFGVGCNILWVVIPMKFMRDIIKRQ